MQDDHNLPQPNDDESPFEAGRTPCPQGGEDRWSARWLMEQMGYPTWQHFEPVVERAKAAAHNQGFNVRTLFTVKRENSGGRPRADYMLTRFAAYLVAMNGDPRKPGVAAGQAYFVVRTRQAEVAEQQPSFLIPKTYAGALRAAAEQAERAELAEQQNKALTARIEKDAPLVAKAESHSNADNAAINRQAFAREVQQWGLLQDVKVLQEQVYEVLRQHGMLVAGNRSDRNHATAQAVKAGWAWTKKDTTPEGYATATTYIRAKGQDLAWKWITDHVREFGDLRPRGVA